MLIIYVIALSGAATLFALAIQRSLLEIGLGLPYDTLFLAGFQGGLVYAALHLLYIAFLRFIFPTRPAKVLLSATLAQVTVVVLVAILTGWPVVPPFWEYVGIRLPASLVPIANILPFWAAFAVVHFLSLVFVLFSATQSEPAGRYPALGYFLAALVLVAFIGRTHQRLMQTLPAEQKETLSAGKDINLQGMHIHAHEVHEGKGVVLPLPPPGKPSSLCAYMALAPESMSNDTQGQRRLYISVAVSNDKTTRKYETILPLEFGQWGVLRVPAEYFSEHPKQVTLRWNTRQRNPLAQLLGIRSSSAAPSASALLSTPRYVPDAGSDRPSVILIAVDGFGAQACTFHGWQRPTTPKIEGLLENAEVFEFCYTPSLSARDALFSLLTGLNPLEITENVPDRHLSDMEEARWLPTVFEKSNYLTTAFVVAAGNTEPWAQHGSGIEEGFFVFREYPAITVDEKSKENGIPGAFRRQRSADVLRDAKEWVEAHAAQSFFLFVRLNELALPPSSESSATAPDSGVLTQAAYESRVAVLDKALASFIQEVRKTVADETIIVLAGLYGLEFQKGRRIPPRLSEPQLRVPLIVFSTKPANPRWQSPVTLPDAYALIVERIKPGYTATLPRPSQTLPKGYIFSVLPGENQISFRYQGWRFTARITAGKETELDPDKASPYCVEPLELTDTVAFWRKQWQPNWLRRDAKKAAEFREVLASFCGRITQPNN